jgi:hypothetical protein
VSGGLRVPELRDLRGMPFLDNGFACGRLLAVVAAARHGAAQKQGLVGGLSRDQAEAWLAPSRAYLLNAGPEPMPARPLTEARKQQVSDVLAGLSTDMSPWGSLLALPVRYARLYPANGAISASSRGWPQHVLLADDAFATEGELREQVLHELAHQWLYLIEDIWPLDTPSAGRLTLPSGTSNRSPSEILGAAHVAAVLIRLYRTVNESWSATRINALASYGKSCLELVGSAGADLTGEGNLIAQQLKETL